MSNTKGGASRARASARKAQGVSLQAAADALGMARQSLSEWERKGCVVRFPDRSVDLTATATLIDQNRNPNVGAAPSKPASYVAQVTGTPAAPAQMTKAASRARKEDWASAREEAKTRLLIGELIPLAEARRIYLDAVVMARASLEVIPVRMADRLVGLDAPTIRALLTTEIETVLRGMSRAASANPNGSPPSDSDV